MPSGVKQRNALIWLLYAENSLFYTKWSLKFWCIFTIYNDGRRCYSLEIK